MAHLNASETGTVLPFRSKAERVGYAPGTVPFDPTNPAHIEAWNAICALGRSERRRIHGEVE